MNAPLISEINKPENVVLAMKEPPLSAPLGASTIAQPSITVTIQPESLRPALPSVVLEKMKKDQEQSIAPTSKPIVVTTPQVQVQVPNQLGTPVAPLPAKKESPKKSSTQVSFSLNAEREQRNSV